jgi:shikimate dehydrogenase
MGANTDGAGFLLFLSLMGLQRPGNVCILGAGGAGKTLAYALSDTGANVSVASRRKIEFESPIVSLSWEEFPGILASSDLLINTTPLGMEGAKAGDFLSLEFLKNLNPQASVVDLIYHPTTTKLLEAASALHLNCHNGYGHLVSQAALSFTFFTGISLEQEEVRQLIINAR